ncbi:DNA-directed RNA polymerase, alpha subunit [Campylobacter blaseri]|uniref:DNA-directed RNA polymerase subunit alpha n=1 Tax=Campylobacter blaseri TaxID=2042961 RepID=A0A2P8R3Y7_9BACT|nr:DNA-directed RNA polymerase subunit alpha [Campylobacter blaseri]PSM53183.1 DNA-directed RNA polymerase subunit alpha [Campylobacter blaseri]PSM54649.1 DNA-directed RNA polymerase subunit alpha [Campylobacter blaseri]QKF86874.1 DNA-directed RNA polymerase, alpha subunit [Campylobacter blaseri]
MRKVTTSAYMPSEIKVENISENVAKVIAYPFETGYAVTVAHPLRRLLYTSTVGFAPTAIKIDGVTHEFDSIRGMLEDVAVFIINLKNLRFKIKSDSKREVIEYNFEGPKEIKGEDLVNDIVDIVNPDHYIATINEDANIKFSIVIEKGIGYVPSEELTDYIDKEYMPVDAFFTPVKRAIYDIENVLVEDNPDYEKIIFTITTNGQISPIEAFKNALEAMYKQLSVFSKIVDVDVPAAAVSTTKQNEHAKLFESVENLNLSARSFNCLDKANIKYIGELALMEESELKDIKNLGKKSLEEIKAIMEEIGYPVGCPELAEQKDALLKKIKEFDRENSEG